MYWKPKLRLWYCLHTLTADKALCKLAGWKNGQFRFEFYLYRDQKDWNAVCQKWHPDKKKTRGMCLTKPGQIPAIMMPKSAITTRYRGTIVHEAVHAALHLYRLRGFSPTKKEEGFALLVDAVVRSVYDDLQKIQRKRP